MWCGVVWCNVGVFSDRDTGHTCHTDLVIVRTTAVGREQGGNRDLSCPCQCQYSQCQSDVCLVSDLTGELVAAGVLTIILIKSVSGCGPAQVTV